MRELVCLENPTPENIKKYIEDRENVKLYLKNSCYSSTGTTAVEPHYDYVTLPQNEPTGYAYTAITLEKYRGRGGHFNFFTDNDELIETIDANDHLGKTIIFSADWKHSRDAYTDIRKARVLFFSLL